MNPTHSWKQTSLIPEDRLANIPKAAQFAFHLAGVPIREIRCGRCSYRRFPLFVNGYCEKHNITKNSSEQACSDFHLSPNPQPPNFRHRTHP